MSVPKRKEQSTKAVAQKCLDCRHGDKSVEASRARFAHHLSIGRSRGEKRLKDHLNEQYGEEAVKYSWAGELSHISRKLKVEAWRQEK